MGEMAGVEVLKIPYPKIAGPQWMAH